MRFSDGIEQYASGKHSLGYKFVKGRSYLAGLLRQTGDVELENITEQDVTRYLDNPPLGIATWRLKYQVLLRFFEFWFSTGVTAELLMPPAKLPIQQNFTPYIYTRDQLRGLIKAIAEDRTAIMLDPHTTRTFLLLLYGTGATVGEALGLTCNDVETDTQFLIFWQNRYSRVRRIPIGADLRNVLQKYLKWRKERNFQCPLLFATKTDVRAERFLFERSFRRLRRIAGIFSHDSRYPPRLFDLRYTFAVHRITSWIRRGKDLNRMLPALAAYMGLAGFEGVEKYLHLTPERFRRDLVKLSPKRPTTHWRDNPELMAFLATLSASPAPALAPSALPQPRPQPSMKNASTFTRAR